MSKRCKHCNFKKSFLLECKCKNFYCSKDILPEIHNCSKIGEFRKVAYDQNEKKLLDESQKEKFEWIT